MSVLKERQMILGELFSALGTSLSESRNENDSLNIRIFIPIGRKLGGPISATKENNEIRQCHNKHRIVSERFLPNCLANIFWPP